MAEETTTREQFEEAVRKASYPTPVEEREQANETMAVGDENQSDVRDVSVDIVDTDGSAITPEVHVKVDDADDSASVFMPDAGIGRPDLPVWAFLDGKRVEDVFSGVEAAEVSDADRASAAADGRTPDAARGIKSE